MEPSASDLIDALKRGDAGLATRILRERGVAPTLSILEDVFPIALTTLAEQYDRHGVTGREQPYFDLARELWRFMPEAEREIPDMLCTFLFAGVKFNQPEFVRWVLPIVMQHPAINMLALVSDRMYEYNQLRHSVIYYICKNGSVELYELMSEVCGGTSPLAAEVKVYDRLVAPAISTGQRPPQATHATVAVSSIPVTSETAAAGGADAVMKRPDEPDPPALYVALKAGHADFIRHVLRGAAPALQARLLRTLTAHALIPLDDPVAAGAMLAIASAGGGGGSGSSGPLVSREVLLWGMGLGGAPPPPAAPSAAVGWTGSTALGSHYSAHLLSQHAAEGHPGPGAYAAAPAAIQGAAPPVESFFRPRYESTSSISSSVQQLSLGAASLRMFDAASLREAAAFSSSLLVDAPPLGEPAMPTKYGVGTRGSNVPPPSPAVNAADEVPTLTGETLPLHLPRPLAPPSGGTQPSGLLRVVDSVSAALDLAAAGAAGTDRFYYCALHFCSFVHETCADAHLVRWPASAAYAAWLLEHFPAGALIAPLPRMRWSGLLPLTSSSVATACAAAAAALGAAPGTALGGTRNHGSSQPPSSAPGSATAVAPNAPSSALVQEDEQSPSATCHVQLLPPPAVAVSGDAAILVDGPRTPRRDQGSAGAPAVVSPGRALPLAPSARQQPSKLSALRSSTAVSSSVGTNGGSSSVSSPSYWSQWTPFHSACAAGVVDIARPIYLQDARVASAAVFRVLPLPSSAAAAAAAGIPASSATPSPNTPQSSFSTDPPVPSAQLSPGMLTLVFPIRISVESSVWTRRHDVTSWLSRNVLPPSALESQLYCCCRGLYALRPEFVKALCKSSALSLRAMRHGTLGASSSSSAAPSRSAAGSDAGERDLLPYSSGAVMHSAGDAGGAGPRAADDADSASRDGPRRSPMASRKGSVASVVSGGAVPSPAAGSGKPPLQQRSSGRPARRVSSGGVSLPESGVMATASAAAALAVTAGMGTGAPAFVDSAAASHAHAARDVVSQVRAGVIAGEGEGEAPDPLGRPGSDHRSRRRANTDGAAAVAVGAAAPAPDAVLAAGDRSASGRSSAVADTTEDTDDDISEFDDVSSTTLAAHGATRTRLGAAFERAAKTETFGGDSGRGRPLQAVSGKPAADLPAGDGTAAGGAGHRAGTPSGSVYDALEPGEETEQRRAGFSGRFTHPADALDSRSSVSHSGWGGEREEEEGEGEVGWTESVSRRNTRRRAATEGMTAAEGGGKQAARATDAAPAATAGQGRAVSTSYASPSKLPPPVPRSHQQPNKQVLQQRGPHHQQQQRTPQRAPTAASMPATGGAGQARTKSDDYRGGGGTLSRLPDAQALLQQSLREHVAAAVGGVEGYLASREPTDSASPSRLASWTAAAPMDPHEGPPGSAAPSITTLLSSASVVEPEAPYRVVPAPLGLFPFQVAQAAAAAAQHPLHSHQLPQGPGLGQQHVARLPTHPSITPSPALLPPRTPAGASSILPAGHSARLLQSPQEATLGVMGSRILLDDGGGRDAPHAHPFSASAQLPHPHRSAYSEGETTILAGGRAPGEPYSGPSDVLLQHQQQYQPQQQLVSSSALGGHAGGAYCGGQAAAAPQETASAAISPPAKRFDSSAATHRNTPVMTPAATRTAAAASFQFSHRSRVGPWGRQTAVFKDSPFPGSSGLLQGYLDVLARITDMAEAPVAVGHYYAALGGGHTDAPHAESGGSISPTSWSYGLRHLVRFLGDVIAPATAAVAPASAPPYPHPASASSHPLPSHLIFPYSQPPPLLPEPPPTVSLVFEYCEGGDMRHWAQGLQPQGSGAGAAARPSPSLRHAGTPPFYYHHQQGPGLSPGAPAAPSSGRIPSALAPPPPLPDVIGLCHQLACALASLHAVGVVHGGLAPPAILLKRGMLKLAGVGWAPFCLTNTALTAVAPLLGYRRSGVAVGLLGYRRSGVAVGEAGAPEACHPKGGASQGEGGEGRVSSSPVWREACEELLQRQGGWLPRASLISLGALSEGEEDGGDLPSPLQPVPGTDAEGSERGNGWGDDAHLLPDAFPGGMRMFPWLPAHPPPQDRTQGEGTPLDSLSGAPARDGEAPLEAAAAAAAIAVSAIFNPAADVFAAGCLVFSLLTGGARHAFGPPGLRVANILTGQCATRPVTLAQQQRWAGESRTRSNKSSGAASALPLLAIDLIDRCVCKPLPPANTGPSDPSHHNNHLRCSLRAHAGTAAWMADHPLFWPRARSVQFLASYSDSLKRRFGLSPTLHSCAAHPYHPVKGPGDAGPSGYCPLGELDYLEHAYLMHEGGPVNWAALLDEREVARGGGSGRGGGSQWALGGTGARGVAPSRGSEGPPRPPQGPDTPSADAASVLAAASPATAGAARRWRAGSGGAAVAHQLDAASSPGPEGQQQEDHKSPLNYYWTYAKRGLHAFGILRAVRCIAWAHGEDYVAEGAFGSLEELYAYFLDAFPWLVLEVAEAQCVAAGCTG